MARFMIKPTTGKSSNRKQKYQKICGWETTDFLEETDIETWVHLQQSLSKKDKLKTPTEQILYKHVPKRRCVGLVNCSLFEKNSLHEKFYDKPDEDALKKTSTSSQTASKLVTNVKQATANESRLPDIGKQGHDGDGKSSQDDMDLRPHEEPEKSSQVSSHSKRSRSVPITTAMAEYRASKASRPSHTMRRMMYYARKYEAKDSVIVDEDEDEGYGSKTPSAEDKDMKQLDAAYLTNNWATDYFKDSNSSVSEAPRVAKFSYTHQGTTKSQLYGDSEDGDTKESVVSDVTNTNYVKYYKSGYMENAKKILISKQQEKLERTCAASIVNGYDTSNLDGRLEELKPVTMVLRKISIQDSEVPSIKVVEETPPEPMYEIHRSFSRSYSTLQSERAQYPVNCTSPELKFIHGQRPLSRPSAKLKMDIDKNHSDIVANTNFSVLDFHRSHTSVCMPLGDLFPAMYRNLKDKHSANSMDTTISLPSTARDHVSRDPQTTPRLSSADDVKMDYYTERKAPTLNSPFKQHSKGNRPKENRKHAQRLFVTDVYNPAMKGNTDGINRISHPRIKDENLGSDSLELSMSGFRIEIKGELEPLFQEKSSKTKKHKSSKHANIDTKKKLRDAFSRFYNQGTTASGRSQQSNWSEGCRYTWNT